MTGAGQPDDVPPGTDAAELIAQIRQLAGADPAGVQQVVADVLAALDRAAGGTLREQLPDGLPFAGRNGEPPVRPSDLGAITAIEGFPGAAEQLPAAAAESFPASATGPLPAAAEQSPADQE